MNILIIDDEKDLCLLLKSMLTRRGHDVEYALTLSEGMQKANSEVLEVVLLDNNLPDGFGLNYIQKIKAINPNCTLIFMSAMSNLKSECELLGVDYFLEKPVSFKSIHEIISQEKKVS